MNKLIAFFLYLLFGTGLLVGITAGGGGIMTTDLTAAITASNTTIPVETTSGFVSGGDRLSIGHEVVYYTGVTSTTFTGVTRGYDGTAAVSHESGTRLMTMRASQVNNALGFNLVAVQDTLGWATILAIPVLFLTNTLPHIIRMGTPLLTGDLAILIWLFYILVAAFILTLALTIIGARRVV